MCSRRGDKTGAKETDNRAMLAERVRRNMVGPMMPAAKPIRILPRQHDVGVSIPHPRKCFARATKPYLNRAACAGRV